MREIIDQLEDELIELNSLIVCDPSNQTLQARRDLLNQARNHVIRAYNLSRMTDQIQPIEILIK